MGLTDKLTAIANAIRAKTGKSGTMTPDQMPDEIASIPNGIASEPFVEEIYDDNGSLVEVKLVGYTKVRNFAFYNCTKLALTELPAGLTGIGTNAFTGCTNLTTITFKGIPKIIGPDAFSSCTNLTTINVPWAEGAVANAPWGATNATINYNYTEEG